MRIEKSGCTRFVFVFSDIVVKVPKMFIIRPFIRLFYHLAKRQVKEKLKVFDEKSMVKAMLKYFFPGIVANRLELNYSKKHKSHDKIMHVSGVCFGLILIQKKVEIVKAEDKRWENFLSLLKRKGIKDFDMLVAHNFGLENNQFKLIDYGRKETILELHKLRYV